MDAPPPSQDTPSEFSRHPHPERVADQNFQAHRPFFNPEDLVQVKYEMLRAHHVDGMPVRQAARRYGLSRQTFYLVDAAFRAARLLGLLPGRPGPKGPRKVTPEMAEFIRAQWRAHPRMDLAALAAAAAARFGIQVHPRTIRRLVQSRGARKEGRPRRGMDVPDGRGPGADQV